jgi:hypothetical protein
VPWFAPGVRLEDSLRGVLKLEGSKLEVLKQEAAMPRPVELTLGVMLALLHPKEVESLKDYFREREVTYDPLQVLVLPVGVNSLFLISKYN